MSVPMHPAPDGEGADQEHVRGRPRRLALSPSRASDFKQCPLLYRFRAIDRLPETPSKAQVRGTVVHAALEALFALPAGDRVSDRAKELVEPAWERVLADAPELADLIGPGDRGQFLTDARRLISNYYRLEDPTRFDPESCELRVETELDDGVLLRGFVDRVDVSPTGLIRVVDYKTGRAPWELSESKALFQMKFYALVLLRTRGVVPARLQLLYLGDGQTLTYEPDEAELLRFGRTLSAIWQAITDAGTAGDFRPNPGRLCDWCDHKTRCPAFGGTPPPYPGWPDVPSEESSEFEEIVE
ncbi:RecB family exonuclease [Rhodococcus hoagii]|nr:RecB family exonuclease [Prescottella equi]